MICKNCGNEVNINEKFCGFCGAEVENVTMLVDDDDAARAENPYTKPAQPQQAPQSVYTPQQPVQQPQYQQPMQPQYQQPMQPQYQQPMQPQYQQPVQPYAQPMQPQYGAPARVPTADEVSLSGRTLGFGIAGISCSAIGFLFVTAILGIIFSAISLKNHGLFAARGYRGSGKATAGKVLAIIGLVFGIFWAVYMTVAIIIAIATEL